MSDYNYKGLTLDEMYDLPIEKRLDIYREIAQNPLEEQRFIDASCKKLNDSLDILEPIMSKIFPETYN